MNQTTEQNGKIAILPALIKLFGKSVILVTGEQSFIKSKHSEILLRGIEAAGIRHYNMTISGEPSPEIIDQAVAGFRDESVNVVVSIGGGSVIDAGKALSAMMYKKESVKVFLEVVGTKDHPGTKIPFIAIPTTSGT